MEMISISLFRQSEIGNKDKKSIKIFISKRKEKLKKTNNKIGLKFKTKRVKSFKIKMI